MASRRALATVEQQGDGKSRNFGFVGFKSEKDAHKALKYFQDTYIDTSKITVEFAKPVGDSSLSRPWSKYSEGSSAHDRVTKKHSSADVSENPTKPEKKLSKEAQLLQKAKTDPEMKAFVESFKPRSKTKIWENDDPLLAAAEVKQVGTTRWIGGVEDRKEGEGEENKQSKGDVFEYVAGGEAGTSDEEYEDVPKKQEDGEKEDGEGEAKGAGKDANQAFNPALDDMAYLKAKMSSSWKDSDDEDEGASEDEMSDEGGMKKVSKGRDDEEEQEEDEGGEEEDQEMSEGEGKDRKEDQPDMSHVTQATRQDVEQDKRDDDEDDEVEDGRLFVRNLPYSTSEEELTAFFSKFGELSEVHICIHNITKEPTGMAFILFLIPSDADKQAKQRRKEEEEQKKLEAGKDGSSYKAKKKEQQKKTSASSHNWNMLFMRSDTVAEAIANKHQMDKAQLLDHESSSSMAVRMALGETHIIETTKSDLRENGVNVSCLEVAWNLFLVEKKPRDRSNTAMLVKNIPFSTTLQELRELFERFGDVSHAVLPKTKTMAIVDFTHPSEARKAFKSLAYSQFKHQPIYLEWAPVDIFLPGAPTLSSEGGKKQPKAVEEEGKTQEGGKAGKQEKQQEEKSPEGSGRTLYVKNLNFKTTEEALKGKMEGGGGEVKAVRIVTKPNPKAGKDSKEPSRLSMGYGFVEFKRSKDANEALRKLQGTKLDGHVLQLKMSSRVSADSSAGEVDVTKDNRSRAKPSDSQAPQDCSKLVIRNVPFEANKKELRDLLSSFGELTSLRLPSKFDGSHRGFAFAEFVTHQEAAAAKDALGATHLYGRHLVIEWAEEEQSLEAVRRKTARYFSKLSEATSQQASDDVAPTHTLRGAWGLQGTAKRRKIEETLEENGEMAFEEAFD
ncbi:hypothetical protein GUITHDRAFT_109452 [Guillardia theta CCMP2712]|uniref:RRM domain-containing protein n=1 Tax=Guillardia theta (strain CCMP2712) TaxID=905079 RepID=L1J992_GUITC|nr:hypothetical protein GUITHDRAFT_109452 [Guillardia theta CCMP2712]EKX44674.1 hypothetical protein GUITHDRAFT_109452 [Guillardia theta CCMP2712]|eukprot:XP_005831654.1 hypothetical protein GUITHDRAFT_109452 [Guillardia theta CCMP2712]